jgi:hypothetical protein
VKIRDTVVHSGYNFILWIQFCTLDTTACSKVTVHAKRVTIVVDMRRHKMDREASKREVKDGHYVAEIGAGGGGAVPVCFRQKIKGRVI